MARQQLQKENNEHSLGISESKIMNTPQEVQSIHHHPIEGSHCEASQLVIH